MTYHTEHSGLPDILTIRTLGAFSVSVGGKVISDKTARSQKLWRVFKYLITNRHKMISTDTLIEMLWPENEPENPQNSLQSLVSRLRRLLADNGVKEPYILFQHDSYRWNTDLPIDFDIDEFERLYTLADKAQTDDEKLPYLRKIVEIYAGDYLAELSYELWLLPVTMYYKQQYVRCVINLADIYARVSAQDEIIKLCNMTVRVEPYEEEIFDRLIRTLIMIGRTAEAEKLYRRFSELIQTEFGAQPSEELRSLCQSIKAVNGGQLDIEDIKERLEGKTGRSGVFFCTPDVFNQIYELDKRSDERMKFPVFLGLITLIAANGKPLETKHLKNTMRTLRQSLARTLRQGDVVSQYSKNQFVLLLSAYQPENAETALKRVQRLFADEYRGGMCVTQINLSQIGK